MRVLLCLASASGGIGTHVANLARSLAAAGHEVLVATDPRTRARFDLPGDDPLRAARVRALSRGADIVHAHGFRAGFVASVARPRVPLVVSLHNPIRGRPSPRRVLGEVAGRLVMRRADLVTGASGDLVADARALGARRAELAEVPSPRVPALLATSREAWRGEHRGAWLRRYGLDPGAPFVLTIARVAPQKGIDVLAAAAALDPVGQWGLLGPGQAGLEPDPPALRLLGESRDVTAWLLAADVLTVPSEWEARALVVQEAMAAGTPVVARRVGGLPDLLEGVGRLVAGGEGPVAPALAAAVGELIADPDLAAADATRARERAGGWAGLAECATRWTLRYADLRA